MLKILTNTKTRVCSLLRCRSVIGTMSESDDGLLPAQRFAGQVQHGSISDDAGVCADSTLVSESSALPLPILHVYRCRWYILMVYSILAFMQVHIFIFLNAN